MILSFTYTVGKNEISDFYGSKTSSWKTWRWARLDLIFTRGDIYISLNLNPLTKFTSRSRSTKFKDILPWNISQMITRTIPISTRIVISYAMKRGVAFWVWGKFNENWDNNMMIKISMRETWGKAILKEIKASEERKKEIQKSRTLTVTVRNLSRKVNHLSKVNWDRRIITPDLSAPPEKVNQSLWWTLKPPKGKHISRCVDRWSMHKDEEGDW